MNPLTLRTPFFVLLPATLAGLILFAGCERTAHQAKVEPGEPLPAGLIVQTAPAGAKGVIETKKQVKEGDEVVLRGRVGGAEKPLVENRAVLTLLDSGIETCDKMTGDGCKTPWDACCESDLPKKTATVQVVHEDGKPFKAGLEGVSGIKPLKEVVVVGKVKGPVDEKQLVIEATKIYVVP